MSLWFDTSSTLAWYPQNSSEAAWASSFPGLSQWVYWALTWDDTAQQAELFINGISKGQKSVAQSYSTTTAYFTAAGFGSSYGLNSAHVAGYGVYPTILSATRIAAHYGAGTGMLIALPWFRI